MADVFVVTYVDGSLGDMYAFDNEEAARQKAVELRWLHKGQITAYVAIDQITPASDTASAVQSNRLARVMCEFNDPQSFY